MRKRIDEAKKELERTDAHKMLAKTVSDHFVSSEGLRYGVIDAIKKIAPKIEHDEIKTQAVIENFKKLLIDECKIGPTNDKFLITKEVGWLIKNLKSIKEPSSEIEKRILHGLIGSLESDFNSAKAEQKK
ncbi:MAG: hypothetical protein V1672_00435 [Candidatus Diapherotrites archaeon]